VVRQHGEALVTRLLAIVRNLVRLELPDHLLDASRGHLQRSGSSVHPRLLVRGPQVTLQRKPLARSYARCERRRT
jgi:hypothetical protein